MSAYSPIEDLPADVLLDTPLVRDVLFAEALPHVKRDHLKEDRHVRAFFAYLQSCRRRVTTSQVVTEVDGHFKRHVRGGSLRNARAVGFGRAALLFEEASVAPLASLDFEIIAGHGPTDASLLEVAQRESLALLTGDAALHGLACKRGLACLCSWQLVSHPGIFR